MHQFNRILHCATLTDHHQLLQIAIFVLPVMVLAGWAIGKDFALTYIDPFIAMFLTLSVVHAYFVSSDGNSNWLMGVQLIGTYTLIAMLYLMLAY